jgi:hypothetical protein
VTLRLRESRKAFPRFCTRMRSRIASSGTQRANRSNRNASSVCR